jgi:hypothetical protein
VTGFPDWGGTPRPSRPRPPQSRPAQARPARPARPRESHLGWRWLLLLPILAPLFSPWYNRDHPRLAGVPFFYWFQIACVLVAIASTAAVYWLTRAER